MIHAILLNPTIDIIYKINNFKVGGTFKVNHMLKLPVGKAISFAIAAREFNHEIKLNVLAFIGKEEMSVYSQFLDEKNISYEFIPINGSTRSNKTIIDPLNNTTTHIREKGFSVGSEGIERLKSLIKSKVKKNDYCVFGGSIPAGVNTDIYYDLIKLAKTEEAVCILDSSGPALTRGLDAKPDIIKPNLTELAQILEDTTLAQLKFNQPIKDANNIIQKAKTLRTEKLTLILITLGKKGAILLSKQNSYFGWINLNKEVIDTVGAGDSFLAGFLIPYSNGKDLKKCLKYAISTGAASCLKIGPGVFKKIDQEELLKDVKVEKLH